MIRDTSMADAKTRQPGLLPETPMVSDEAITALHQRFGFPDGFQIGLLRSELKMAAEIYWYFLPPPTARQQAEDLRRLHRFAGQLLDALGRDEVRFPDVEPPGIRRPLFELRYKAGQHAHRYEQMPPERGRKPEHGLDSFICCLQHTYYLGTRRTDLYTMTTSKSGREGGLLQFVSAAADLYGIDVPDDSIAIAIKRLEKEGKLERWRMGRKRP